MMATESTPSISQIVIRLLNGPLQGCEFLLAPGRTLFVVGQPATFIASDRLPEFPNDTLYIPLDAGGINFELHNGESLELQELGDSAGARRQVELNRLQQVGELTFALKHESEIWPAGLLSTVETPLAPPRPKARNALIAAAVVIGLLLAGIGYKTWHMPQRQFASLSENLGNDAQRFTIMPGRDNLIYVATHSERESFWVHQEILRSQYRGQVRVVYPAQENERVGRWLSIYYPSLSWYRLQLSNPLQPQLWVSQQRTTLNEAAREKLTHDLLAQLPYAETIKIMQMDDAAAANQAESGLVRLGLPFTRNDRGDGVSFSIRGELDDGQLLRARRFVEGYYSQWGNRYVQFAIELQEDRLKGHSWQYGEQGYVKMATGHWQFSNSM